MDRVEEHASAQGRERERGREREGGRERERESTLASPFMFFLPLGLPYVNWAWPGVRFVLPKVFTPVL